MVYVFLLPLGVSGLAFWERAPLILTRLATEVSAAWAQAICSVVAIFAAIWISRREAAQARTARQADEAEVCRLSVNAIDRLRLELQEIERILPKLIQLPTLAISRYCDNWEGCGVRRVRAAGLMLTRTFPTKALEALLVVEDAGLGIIEIAKDVRANSFKADYWGQWVRDMLANLRDAEKVLNWVREDLGFPP